MVEKGIAPKDIIVVTFTNKAANEMKMRLVQLIGEAKTGALLIGTFHSICCRLLRRHGKTIGLKSDFTIADNTTRSLFFFIHVLIHKKLTHIQVRILFKRLGKIKPCQNV